MNVLSLKDEKQTFECTLPAKDLFKSVTEIKINRKKLIVINLYYTTDKCHIRGSQSKSWIEQEYEALNKIVTEYKGKGDNSNIDSTIVQVKQSDFYEIPNEDFNKSQTFPKSVDEHELNVEEDIETTEKMSTKHTSTKSDQLHVKAPLENRDNCGCHAELAGIKDTLHKLEQAFVQKTKNEEKLLQKLDDFFDKLDLKLVEKEIKQLRSDFLDASSDIKEEITKMKAEVVEVIK